MKTSCGGNREKASFLEKYVCKPKGRVMVNITLLGSILILYFAI